MMINKYSLRLDEDRLPMLVMEESFHYEGRRSSCTTQDMVIHFLSEKEHVMDLPEEHAYVLALDNKGKIIGYFEVSVGSFNRSIIDSSAIFKRLLAVGAINFIFVHNHPSGDSTPSDHDMAISKKLSDGAALLGMKMLDFLIIGNNNYFSFEEKALL